MTSIRVLLVEDEPEYARFLREILLEAVGDEYHVTWESTLEKAIAQLGCDEEVAPTFDIVLLDLGLPDADGTEALSEVTACVKTTPIVVLSSRSDVDTALESMRLGAQEYLVKGESEHLMLPRAIRYARERKRLQDEMTAARAEAERANAVKDEFLAMLSHELRNPLAPIVTGLALMRKQGHDATLRQLDVVDRQVQHVVRLVDDLLDVSRIARGKLEIHRARIDVADAIQAGCEAAAPLVHERGHTIHSDVPRETLFVYADSARIAQVVANLLTNAAKYTDPGGTIWLRARDGGGVVEVSVRDSGTGIPQPMLERVFDTFEQGKQSIERKSGGLGLGLAIVRNIVLMHGGAVTARSEGPGKGSEFVVLLPIHRVRAREVDTTPTPSIAEMAPKGRRILIVDDSPDGADMLDLAMTMAGHETRTCTESPAALVAATEMRPDVALLDIGLPVMDGFELARRIREALGPSTPVLIALTGYGQESDRRKSREAGFDYHLVKPIDPNRLAELIASLPAK